MTAKNIPICHFYFSGIASCDQVDPGVLADMRADDKSHVTSFDLHMRFNVSGLSYTNIERRNNGDGGGRAWVGGRLKSLFVFQKSEQFRVL